MIIFKYKEEFGRRGQTIKRPVADVFLKSKTGDWIEFHPYIDSGADITLIPLSLGKLIGLKFDEDNLEQIGGIRGSVPVSYHQIKIKIASFELTAKIGWALIEEVPPLLGRENIFDYFNVSFRQKEGIIVFEKSKKNASFLEDYIDRRAVEKNNFKKGRDFEEVAGELDLPIKSRVRTSQTAF